jgi:hypothetical protein
MRYDNIIKNSSNFEKNVNNEEKINMIFSTMKMKGYKNSLNGILDNTTSILAREENKNQYNYKKKRKNRSIDGIISSYGLKKDSNNDFKYKVKKNYFSKKEMKSENKNNNHAIDTIYSILNKTRNKTQSEITNTINRYNSKLMSYSGKNNTMNTTCSFRTELKNKKSPDSNINNKNNLNNLDDKFFDNKTKSLPESRKIKMIKFKQDDKIYKLNRNTSMPCFENKSQKNKKPNFKDSITVYDRINLPNLTSNNFFTKSNLNKSGSLDKLYTKDNNDYNKFYNIFKKDKNFFLGVDFQKKLKKKYILCK